MTLVDQNGQYTKKGRVFYEKARKFFLPFIRKALKSGVKRLELEYLLTHLLSFEIVMERLRQKCEEAEKKGGKKRMFPRPRTS